MKKFIHAWNKASLIKRILIGMLIGGTLGLTLPNISGIGLLGDLFVGGLKAIAPILVFALVANALSQHQKGQDSNMKTVIFLYLVGTFAAALIAVLASFIVPVEITLNSANTDIAPPDGIGQVLSNLLGDLGTDRGRGGMIEVGAHAPSLDGGTGDQHGPHAASAPPAHRLLPVAHLAPRPGSRPVPYSSPNGMGVPMCASKQGVGE